MKFCVKSSISHFFCRSCIYSLVDHILKVIFWSTTIDFNNQNFEVYKHFAPHTQVRVYACVKVDFQSPGSSQPSHEAPESDEECSKLLQRLRPSLVPLCTHTHTSAFCPSWRQQSSSTHCCSWHQFSHVPQDPLKKKKKQKRTLFLNGQTRLLEKLFGHTDLHIFLPRQSGVRFIDRRLRWMENTDEIRLW